MAPEHTTGQWSGIVPDADGNLLIFGGANIYRWVPQTSRSAPPGSASRWAPDYGR